MARNGEVVRVALAIDTHDREVMAWGATVGTGISGEMVHDTMLECVERRFGAIRAPEPVQWLADNGSAYTAAETTEFATALNLYAGPQPRKQRRLRGLCQNHEARLRPGEPQAGCHLRPAAPPRLGPVRA